MRLNPEAAREYNGPQLTLRIPRQPQAPLLRYGADAPVNG